MLTRYDELDVKYKDLDVFILNNISTANNFSPYDELNKIAKTLSKTYKVATVCKVSDDCDDCDDCDVIPSTFADGLPMDCRWIAVI